MVFISTNNMKCSPFTTEFKRSVKYGRVKMHMQNLLVKRIRKSFVTISMYINFNFFLNTIVNFPLVDSWFELAICIKAIANTNSKEFHNNSIIK